MGTGKNQDNLVQVCQQHLLVFTFGSRRHPDQGSLAGFHTLNGAAAILGYRDAHPVPHRSNIPIDPPLFQSSSQAADDPPLSSLDGKKTGLGADDQAWFHRDQGAGVPSGAGVWVSEGVGDFNT